MTSSTGRDTSRTDPNPRTSLTLNLPQWDLDTTHHLLIAETGTLEAGIEIQMPPALLAGYAQQENVHAAFMRALRNALPEGERARIFIEVAPLANDILQTYDDHFDSDNDFLRALRHAKAERFRDDRKNGELLDVRYYLTFTTSPNRTLMDKVMQRVRQGYETTQYQALAERANAARVRMFQALSRAGFAPRVIDANGLFHLAWRYFNPHERSITPPTFVPTKAHLPTKLLRERPDLSDRTLRSQLTRTGIRRGFEWLRSSRYYQAIVSLEALPVGHTFTGMVDHLLMLPGTYWLVIDLEHRPYGRTLRELYGRARRMTAAANDPGDFTDYADPGNRVGASEADSALIYATQHGSHFFKVGLSLLLLSPEHKALEESVESAIDALTQLPGARYVRETFGLMEQLLNLSPGSGRPNDRMFQTLEENATAFVPTTGPWRGDLKRPMAMFHNRWGGVSALDLFDPRSANWNGIVIGGSGSGKTFLMQVLANELLSNDAEVIIVDRGGGYDPLINLHDGEIIPLAPGKVTINPFDLPPGAHKPSDEKRAFLLALIKTMLRVSDGTITGATDTIVGAAVDQTYHRASREERDEDGNARVVYTGCRLSDLVQTLLRIETLGERTATEDDRLHARRIATVLQAWTGDNPLGRFLDGATSIDPKAKVVGYETSGLINTPQLAPIGIMLIANMVWERAERDRERPKLVIFDEVWSLLKVPEAATFVVELYRRFRRYNAAAYTVTQSLADFMTPEARGILQNTTHFFLLKLRGEDDAVRDLFKLQDSAMVAFTSLTSAKGEFSEALTWIQRQDRVEGDVIRVRPHPIEYWAFTTDAYDMSMREAAVARAHGSLSQALLELARTHPNGAGIRSSTPGGTADA